MALFKACNILLMNVASQWILMFKKYLKIKILSTILCSFIICVMKRHMSSSRGYKKANSQYVNQCKVPSLWYLVKFTLKPTIYSFIFPVFIIFSCVYNITCLWMICLARYLQPNKWFVGLTACMLNTCKLQYKHLISWNFYKVII